MNDRPESCHLGLKRLKAFRQLGNRVLFDSRSLLTQVLPLRKTRGLAAPFTANEPQRTLMPMRAFFVADKITCGLEMFHDRQSCGHFRLDARRDDKDG
ncbi:hypothetical protein [Neorhodopirellula lusitana]|uniref:hypothetical protein n=1 Tax=Neorhodopirellula lusitana TaxID=445327 RepID=UPI00384C37D2